MLFPARRYAGGDGVLNKVEHNMQRHPRDAVVATAQAQLAITVAKIVESHKLSIAEVLSILHGVAATWIKYQVRADREPGAKLHVVRAPNGEG